MRINSYKSLIDRETIRPVLIKECAVNYKAQKQVNNPEKIVAMLNDIFQADIQTEEYVFMLAFNVKMDLLGVFEISHGTVDGSLCSPRDVLSKALLVGAKYVVVAHNHPSGLAEPSQADIDICKRLSEACKLMDIPLVDNIIVGNGQYFSFKEEEML